MAHPPYAGIEALAWGHDFTFGPRSFEKGAVREFGTKWQFTYGGEKAICGGKLLENIVQALARIITMNAALRIQKRMGLGMQVHHELVYGVPRDAVPEFKKLVIERMRRRPAWAPELPLDAEAGEGDSYGEAK